MSPPGPPPNAPSKPRAGPEPRAGSRVAPDVRRALPLALLGLCVAISVLALASLRWSTSAEVVLHGALLSVLLLVSALGVRRRGSAFGGALARMAAVALGFGAVLALARVAGLRLDPLAVSVEVVLKTVGVVLVGFALGRRAFSGGGRDATATLRSTFDSVSDPIVVTDAGCRIVEVNWFAELRFEEPLRGRLACETPYFRRDACEGCPVGECFDRKSGRFFTVRDDDRRPRFEVATIPVPDEGGAIGGVVQHVTDVRARSIGEERVRFLGDVVAAVEQGVVGVDPAGRVTAMNPSAGRLLGLEENDAIGRRVIDLLPWAHEADRRRVKAGLAAGRRLRLDVELEGREERRQVVLSLDPIVDDFGAPIGAALLLRDVTESLAAEARLRQSERLSALGTFVSGLAHELNHPIAAVCAAVERFEQGDADEVSALAEIRAQADRCRRVIAGLLRFARRTVPARRPEDLGKIVLGVVDLLARALRRDGVTLAVSDAGDVVATVDAHLVEQVVLNLITNARDAIRSAGRGGRIDVRVAVEGRDAVVEVADDGPGLPEGDPERLFRAFHTSKPEGSGTGLGLALARGFVEDHGGTLTAARRTPRGARFCVRLPLASRVAEPPDEAPAAPPEDADSRAPSTDVQAAGVVLPSGEDGRRDAVLVVEDEPGIAEYLRFCLESGGYAVTVTNALAEARERLRAGEPFARVVSDVSLGDGRGPDLYREVTAQRPEFVGRFVFVTADSFSDADPLTADGNKVVFKPFGREELLEALGAPATVG